MQRNTQGDWFQMPQPQSPPTPNSNPPVSHHGPFSNSMPLYSPGPGTGLPGQEQRSFNMNMVDGQHGPQSLHKDPTVVSDNDIPIVRWYQDPAKQLPWNILSTRTTAQNYDPRTPPHQIGLGVSFPGAYRGRGPMSEADSSLNDQGFSDSAYGTGPRTYSVHSTEPVMTGQVVAELQDDFDNLKPPFSDRASTVQTKSAYTPQGSSPLQRRHSSLKCQQCGYVARLQSDLNKHVLKHDKPHRCTVRGCTRERGFTTVNDLHRHMKCKHKICHSRETMYYKCVSSKCAHKKNAFSRLDNFRQHLTRVHKGENYKDLEKGSEQVVSLQSVDDASHRSTQTNDPSLNGAGLSFQNAMLQINDNIDPIFTNLNQAGISWGSGTNSSGTNTVIQPSFNSISPYQNTFSGTHTSQMPPYSLSNSSFTQHSNSQPDFAPPSPLETTSNRLGRSQRQNVERVVLHQSKTHQDLELAQISSNLAAKLQSNNPDIQLDEAIFDILQQGYLRPSTENDSSMQSTISPSESALAILETTDSSSPTSYKNPTREASSDAQTSPRVSEKSARRPISGSASRQTDEANDKPTCPHCGTIRDRRCDMKKHLRRHTKPFGCTFTHCNKRFGSKNDWKRHENSQHFQTDAWRCHRTRLAASSGRQPQLCAKVFNHKRLFDRHLEVRHGVCSATERADECNSYHIGINGQRRFWCGFCRKICGLEGRGVKAWDERFSHIADHFVGGGCNIDNWLLPAGSRTKAEFQAAKAAAIQHPDDDDSSEYEDDDGGGISPSGARADVETCAPSDLMAWSMPSQDVPPRGGSDDLQLDRVFCCSCGDGPQVKDNSCCTSCPHAFCANCIYCDH